MGYDYDISYKKGRENVVTDALSRVKAGELLSLAVSSISTELMEQIQRSWENDPYLVNLMVQLQGQAELKSPYIWKDNQLIRRGRIVVGNDQDLQTRLIKIFHEKWFRWTFGNACNSKETLHCSLLERNGETCTAIH